METAPEQCPDWLLYVVISSGNGLFVTDDFEEGDIFCMLHVKNRKEQRTHSVHVFLAHTTHVSIWTFRK